MFDRHFEAFLADTQEGRDTHYRLRYQVYCVDTAWFDPARFPDQLERDEYDDRSIPFLIRRKRSKGWIATMRLIRAPLPTLQVFHHTRIDETLIPADAWDSIAEFSRLSVVMKYRRRKAPPDGAISTTAFEDSFLNANYASESWIFMGLNRAAYVWSRENGLRYWVFFVARPLALLIQRSGFDITPLGEEVDYCGPRRPYLFSVARGTANLASLRPEIDAFSRVAPAYRLFSELPEAAVGVRRHRR